MLDAIDLRKKLGAEIRSLRLERGLSQEHLAHETGFGRSAMSAIERGTKDIRLSSIVKVANIFSVSPPRLREKAEKMR